MTDDNYELRTLNLKYAADRKALKEFLETHDLSLERDLDYALCLEDGDRIIACGCSSGNVLKCIAVNREYQGQALTNRVMTYLRLRAYHEGFNSLYLYTKPENELLFSNLGFSLISSAPSAVLMENSPHGCEDYISGLGRPDGDIETAALVMNCNPFTLGHRHLIERACSENGAVHLFILREDLSVFPFADRIELVRQGTGDLKNLYIHEGGDYLISRATFPSYFLKDKDLLDENHAILDLNLFSEKIAPALNITRRYVGEEPFCPVTSLYNRKMKEILPLHGIQVAEIPRKEKGGRVISATRVREALGMGSPESVKEMLPETSYKYLISEKGTRIGKIIREKEHENNEDRTGGIS